jgi:transposase
LKALKRIAIDEISVGRGHRYLTVVLDLNSGAVVFVGEGKGADALNPFWKRLKASRARIEAVAMDMSQAYITDVSANLPRATIVFDHFHVIKLFNEKLTDNWLGSIVRVGCGIARLRHRTCRVLYGSVHMAGGR